MSLSSLRSSSVRAMQFRARTVQVAALHASHRFSRVQFANDKQRRHLVCCARTSGGGLGTSEEEDEAPVAARGESSSGRQSRKC
eukprot:11644874-Alexandrium_andersonii.AAC.1